MTVSLDCPVWLQWGDILKKTCKLLLMVYMICFIKYMNVYKGSIGHDKSPVCVSEWMCPSWKHFISINFLFLPVFQSCSKFTPTKLSSQAAYLYCIKKMTAYATCFHCNLHASFIQSTQEWNKCLASYQNMLNNLTNKYIFTLKHFFFNQTDH